MLFCQVFSSYEFLSHFLLSDDETKPSFQAMVSPASFGTFLGAICGFGAVGLLVAVEMRVVAGRILELGGFFGGHGRALLSPDPIPYLWGDALEETHSELVLGKRD